MRWRPAGLWRNRDFTKLWTAQTISKFGSHVGGAAVAFTAILNLKATPAQMGLLGAIGSAPVLVIGLFAGVWVDRLRRRPILVAADAGRAALLVTIPAAVFLGQLRIEQLYLVAALVGVLTVFFGVADVSALPALVPREQLVEANSKLGASDSVAEIGGQALGGTLVQWLGAPVAIFLDALSFLLSALFIGLIRTPEPPPVPKHERERVWPAIVEGLRVVWGAPTLRSLTISMAVSSFFGNFIGTLYGLYLIRELGLTPALVGLSVSLGGVGSFAAAFLVGPVTRRFGVGATLIGARLVSDAIRFALPFAGGPRPVILLLIMGSQLLGDVAFTTAMIGEVSVRQAMVPHRFLGRANASMEFFTGGVGPLGALVGGVLGQLLGMRLTLLISCLGILLASLGLLLSPLRALRELTAPEAEPGRV